MNDPEEKINLEIGRETIMIFPKQNSHNFQFIRCVAQSGQIRTDVEVTHFMFPNVHFSNVPDWDEKVTKSKLC